MTIKEAKHILSQIGVSLRKTDCGEFRVNFKGGKEATAYYTNDLDDAVGTGKMMVKPRAAYTLTLTQGERQAIDWVGYRYSNGDRLYSVLRECITDEDEEKYDTDDYNAWSCREDITFVIPERKAWEICEIRDEDDGLWPCFASELTEKMNAFCDRVV